MSKEIVIYNIPSVPATREEITNKDNVNKLLSDINNLNNVVLNFDSIEAIKESKQFKTHANKIVKDKLQPIVEREDNLKKLKDNLFIPSLSIDSCKHKLEELELLNNYDWFGLKDEALTLIQQSKTFLGNELIGFEKLAKEKAEADEKARLERDEALRLEGEKRAKEQAEIAIDEANKKAEIKKAEIAEVVSGINTIFDNIQKRKYGHTIKHQRKVHNEILEALIKLPCQSDSNFAIDMKFIIKAIAKGEIPHLFIKY